MSSLGPSAQLYLDGDVEARSGRWLRSPRWRDRAPVENLLKFRANLTAAMDLAGLRSKRDIDDVSAYVTGSH